MKTIFLDTHIVVWLYDKVLDNLSKKAQDAIESNNILISPIVFLELEYLFEIKRIRNDAQTIVDFLNDRIQLKIDDKFNLAMWITISAKEKWTRDPFDRLIVSHAKITKSPLISKDNLIRKHYELTIW